MSSRNASRTNSKIYSGRIIKEKEEEKEEIEYELEDKYIKCDWIRECESLGYIKDDKGLFIKNVKRISSLSDINIEIPEKNTIKYYIENVNKNKKEFEREYNYKCMRREFIGITIDNLIEVSLDYLMCLMIMCGVSDYIDNVNIYNVYNLKVNELSSLFIRKILPLIKSLLENNNEEIFLSYNIMNMSLNGLNNDKNHEYSDKMYKLIIYKIRILYKILLKNEIILFSCSVKASEKGIRVYIHITYLFIILFCVYIYIY